MASSSWRVSEGSFSWGRHRLRSDSAHGGTLSGVETLTDFADSGQLTDSDVKGLFGIFGSPLVTVLLRDDENVGVLRADNTAESPSAVLRWRFLWPSSL